MGRQEEEEEEDDEEEEGQGGEEEGQVGEGTTMRTGGEGEPGVATSWTKNVLLRRGVVLNLVRLLVHPITHRFSHTHRQTHLCWPLQLTCVCATKSRSNPLLLRHL